MDYPFYRMIASPLTEAMLAPLDPRCEHVHFSGPLSDDDYIKLAHFMRDYPEVYLRTFSGLNPMEDLEFLRFFPHLRHFQCQLLNLKTLSGLRHLREGLKSLAIGETRTKSLSLEMLGRFKELDFLSLEGQTKGIEVIGTLTELKWLALRSITLKDLSILLPLKKLQSLYIGLGGTKDLSLLPRIGELKKLELWMIKGFSDLSPVASLKHLQFLFLQCLPNVIEFPDMSELVNLRRVHLETMKGISDLSPIAKAPVLEELLVFDCCHLTGEEFACFKDHPTLKRASVGLGSDRRNNKVANLLQLPQAERS